MSHELSKREDGQHSIAYLESGGKPWHGYGQIMLPGQSVPEWQVNAHQDWSALIVPAQYEFNGQLLTAPNSFHMVRSDTGESLSVMSKRYKPVQPAEIWAWFQSLIAVDQRFVIETAGCLKGGRVIWAMARFQESVNVAGDEHVAYVLLTTSFDGTLATTAQATMIRVVCNNTLTASIFDKRAAAIKVPHHTDFSSPGVQMDVIERLSQVAEGFDHYKVLGEALASVRLSYSQIETVFTDLIVGKAARGDKVREEAPTTKARNQLAQLLDSYRATLAEGTQANTGWAALNAVTRYVDHDRTTRDTMKEGASNSRMASAFFGSGAALKARALETLASVGGLDLDRLGLEVRAHDAPISILPEGHPATVDFDSILSATPEYQTA